MTVIDRVRAVVPVLKNNNRKRSLDFFETSLGLTNIIEEGAWVSLGDKTKVEKLVLEESPSMRSRKVEGPKKLAQIRLKVENPEEIEALLANGIAYQTLYQGKKGYAFEIISPDDDAFLVYAEEDTADLTKLEESPTFSSFDGFTGLTVFEVEQIVLNVVDKVATANFYTSFLGQSSFLDFREAEGKDLTVSFTETWDLAMLRFLLDDFNVEELEEHFAQEETFVPKSKKFLLTQDPSQIELWFEADDR